MEHINCMLNEKETEATVGGAEGRRHTYIGDYIVKSGDHLSIIAQNYRTTVAILQMYNDIPNPDRIHIGDTIRIYR